MPRRAPDPPGRRTAAATLLLAVSLLAVSAAAQPTPATATASQPDPPVVRVSENSTDALWPYTSRRPAPHTATLPINVVVANDPAFVRFVLSRTTEARWNVTRTPAGAQAPNATEGNASSDVESGVVINGTRLEWTDARGSNRYTYIRDTASGEGRWVGETYQLHHGTYLGSRHHVRMYEGGSGADTWTAIQVHREHWDWFRLRHTVDSVDRAQDYLESGFRSSDFPADIRRTWYANGGALDSDGWVTWVEVDLGTIRPMLLQGLVLVSALAVGMAFDGDIGRFREVLRGRLAVEAADLRYLLLASTLASLVLGVRVVAITVETAAPGLSPKAIAGLLYPLLVVGTPTCAVVLARGLDPGHCALAASVGFGTGVIADYLYIDVAAVPVGVLVHRMALLAAIAVIAAGGARGPWRSSKGRVLPVHWLVVFGTLGWVVALVIPLLDLL